MKRQKQRFRHKPEENIWGDCFPTAIACLLDVDPETVPHVFFGGAEGPGMPAMRAWLAERGLGLATIVFSAPLGDVLATMQATNPGLYYMLSGLSRTGVDHVVICCGGKIVWDPSLDDAGIVGPTKHDGNYWIEFLTPATMLEPAA